MKFLELKPGSNLVRFVTAPYRYHCHDSVPSGSQPFEQKVKCFKFNKDVGCSLCDSSFGKSIPRWMIGCYSFTLKDYFILDCDLFLYAKVRDLAKHPSWGDPLKYNLDIIFYKEFYSDVQFTNEWNVIPVNSDILEDHFAKGMDGKINLRELQEMCNPLVFR